MDFTLTIENLQKYAAKKNGQIWIAAVKTYMQILAEFKQNYSLCLIKKAQWPIFKETKDKNYNFRNNWLILQLPPRYNLQTHVQEQVDLLCTEEHKECFQETMHHFRRTSPTLVHR